MMPSEVHDAGSRLSGEFRAADVVWERVVELSRQFKMTPASGGGSVRVTVNPEAERARQTARYLRVAPTARDSDAG